MTVIDPKQTFNATTISANAMASKLEIPVRLKIHCLLYSAICILLWLPVVLRGKLWSTPDQLDIDLAGMATSFGLFAGIAAGIAAFLIRYRGLEQTAYLRRAVIVASICFLFSASVLGQLVIQFISG